MPRQNKKERAKAREEDDEKKVAVVTMVGVVGAKEKEDESSKTLAVRGTMNGESAIKVRSLEKCAPRDERRSGATCARANTR